MRPAPCPCLAHIEFPYYKLQFSTSSSKRKLLITWKSPNIHWFLTLRVSPCCLPFSPLFRCWNRILTCLLSLSTHTHTQPFSNSAHNAIPSSSASLMTPVRSPWLPTACPKLIGPTLSSHVPWHYLLVMSHTQIPICQCFLRMISLPQACLALSVYINVWKRSHWDKVKLH